MLTVSLHALDVGFLALRLMCCATLKCAANNGIVHPDGEDSSFTRHVVLSLQICSLYFDVNNVMGSCVCQLNVSSVSFAGAAKAYKRITLGFFLL